MFHTIVVGVDGRSGGRDALHLARRLTVSEDAGLLAVRAFTPDPYPRHHDREFSAEAAAHHDLDVAIAASGVAIGRRQILAGRPARVLCQAAEAADADLIVVGSSHRGAVGRAVAGDIVAAMLRRAPCPVAIAPRGEHGLEQRIRTIGVGFDGQEDSRRALRLAARLARTAGARMRVLEVATIPATLVSTPAFSQSWLDTYRDEAAEDAATAAAALEDVAADADAVIGSPLPELSALSREVDLLVVGSRAQGPLSQLIAGSTAHALSHEAHCPLLVLPHGAEPADAGAAAGGTGTSPASR
jgi:nucleotide-binding universal stress UspA family protein